MAQKLLAQKKRYRKKWYLIDASGKTLGRLSTEIAKILRGKNKPFLLLTLIAEIMLL